MKSFKNILFVIVLLGFVVNSCQKPDRDNPWDELARLDPEEWAPQNFQIEDVSITEKKLSWTYDDKNIEGFKLDRKRGDESWQVGYQVFDKSTRSFNEIIQLSPEINYSYKFYAFAGDIESEKKDTIFSADIPPPQNLTITSNSTTSLTLNWNYNLTGHEGFIVERKIDNGSWEVLVDNLDPFQNSFIDDGLDLPQNVFSYRVLVFLGDLQSIYAEVTLKYTLSFGEFYKGGIVFYLDENGGGLVCAENDQPSARWGCQETSIGNTYTEIGAGATNTLEIVTECEELGIAALICNDLVLNGYSDWFLPSKDELNLMYTNLKLDGIGSFKDGSYWSSSECTSSYACKQSFYNGFQGYDNKYLSTNVRAIRAF